MKKIILALSIVLLSLTSLTGCATKEEMVLRKIEKRKAEEYYKEYPPLFLHAEQNENGDYELVGDGFDKLDKYMKYASLLSLNVDYDKYNLKQEFYLVCGDDKYSLETDYKTDTMYVLKNGVRDFSNAQAKKEMADKMNLSKTIFMSDEKMKSEAETAVKRELDYGAYNFRKMKASGNDVTGICEYEKNDKSFTVHFFDDGGYEVTIN